jgi:hypothetical protein
MLYLSIKKLENSKKQFTTLEKEIEFFTKNLDEELVLYLEFIF